MSDTPQTDAFDGCAVGLDLCPCAEVIKDHARQLERELAEAQRKLEVWSLRYAGLEVLYLAAMKS